MGEEAGGNGRVKWEGLGRAVVGGGAEERVFYLAPISRNAVFLPPSTSSSDQNHINQHLHNDHVGDDDDDEDGNGVVTKMMMMMVVERKTVAWW